jgi:hypothetical protein
LKKGPKTAIFIEAKSGQFFYFYDQIQVTRIVHLAYYNMCEFCILIPISLFITKIQNLKWGCKTFFRVLYIPSTFTLLPYQKHCSQRKKCTYQGLVESLKHESRKEMASKKVLPFCGHNVVDNGTSQKYPKT